MIKGVPGGTQTDWLSKSRSGIPPLVTRTADVVHIAVTHGPLPPKAGGGSAQPATVYGGARVTTGCPLTSTRGVVAVGCACPPCMQKTVAPK
ncbi:hypothetical protein LVJ94_24760 [Pendulispora rubella]|uniref:Uncharacterized protein n=1 Tax=Pendulispora rubella TaxID=2741070 RepID=A0ABZ2LKW3_9BACT